MGQLELGAGMCLSMSTVPDLPSAQTGAMPSFAGRCCGSHDRAPVAGELASAAGAWQML